MRKVAERDNAIKLLTEQIEKIKSAKLKKKKALKKKKPLTQLIVSEEVLGNHH